MSDYQSRYFNSLALVIGINSYTDRRFATLGEAEADARAMADLLAGSPFNFTVRTLYGQEATRDAILEELFKLRNTQPDDRVLFYFAGHGYTLTDRFGNETGFLAAADTIPDRDFTALELEEVTDLRFHAGAKHIAFIFDACFSGQALGLTRTVTNVAAEKFLTRRAYQVLSAGAGDQTVSDYRSMTDLIVEALRRAELAGLDMVFTLSDLGLHVQQAMARESRRTQIPQFGHLRGSQGGDFVFRVTEEGAIPVAAPGAVPPSRARSFREIVASMPIWGWAVIAVLVVAIVLGIWLASGGIDGGDEVTPTPTPTPTSTEAPTPTDTPTSPPTVNEQGYSLMVDDQGHLMIQIPAGSFRMGFSDEQAAIICVANRPDCVEESEYEDEQPVHKVTLSSFWIDAYEVTNAQYRACVETGRCEPPAEPKQETSYSSDYYANPAFDDYPVVNITWEMADNFCRVWRGGRLPTEAEWEYAARGEEAYIYPWGSRTPASSLLNFCDVNCPYDWAVGWHDDGYANTAPVGSYERGVSPFGVFDMAGNVWEWVSDWYKRYTSASVTNPTGPSEGPGRVRRGGAWSNSAARLRVTNRGWDLPDGYDDDQGFRCVLSP